MTYEQVLNQVLSEPDESDTVFDPAGSFDLDLEQELEQIFGKE